MRTILTSEVKARGKRKEESVIFKQIKLYVVEPLSAGLFGFALFFSILIITKLLAVLVNTIPEFTVDFNDVLLSLIGLVLMGLIKLLENINAKVKNLY